MAWTGETWRRLRLLAGRWRRDADLDEEMRFHLEMRAEEHRASGMDATEAAYAARRRFGSPALIAQEAREASGWPLVESVWRDLRLGMRSLRRSPGFVAVALVSLTLGIGANAAVFSFLNALFLDPIPAVADSGGLIAVYHHTRGGADDLDDSLSYPSFQYVRTANHSFTDLLAYSSWRVTVRAGGQAESMHAQLVSPNYFAVLGIQPAAGRTFLPSEGQTPGADPVAVLAYDVWQRDFAGDPSVVGRPLQVGAGMFSVIGVAARGFRGLSLEREPPAFWLPASMSAVAVPNLRDIIHQWGNWSFSVVGRLKPGVTAAGAASDLTALVSRVALLHPEAAPALASHGHFAAVLVPATQARLSPSVEPDIVQFLELLGVTAALVFLVACFNVAGLVLARAMRRQNELALRLSLGAGPARLIRQLLAENALLSLLGGAAGLLVARWSAAGLSWFGQVFGAAVTIDTSVGGRVVGFTAGVAAICALILTLLPARLASRASLTAVMSGATYGGGTRRRGRAPQALVAIQVVLSVVLLVGASLFVRTLQNARAVDPTIRSQDVVIGELNLEAAHRDPTRGGLFYAQLLERLASLPGVRDAACVWVVPLGGRRGGTDVVIEQREAVEPARPVQVGVNVITPAYFRTVGLPVIAGRNLADTDRAGSMPVAVINETMARQLFPGRHATRQRLSLQWPPETTVEVVGVVRDGPFRNYRARMEPTVYVPLAQRYQPDMTLEVRTTGNVGLVLPAIEREIAAIDKNVPLTRIRTARGHFDAALARERLGASLLSVLGALALLLAAVGLYGLLSYMVAQRTRELGVRMALGARPSGIVRLVFGNVIGLVAAGLAVGVTAALVLARFVSVRRLLFGVDPADPASFAVAIGALVVTAAVAAWLPAWRAAKADPVAALRCE